MAGRNKIHERVYRMVYVAIADILLIHKIKTGADGCVDPDFGRDMCAAMAEKVMPYVTTLEIMLKFLEARGYVGFKFEVLDNDPYYKYSFQAWKKDFAHNFSGGEIEQYDPLQIPKFKGKTKDEVVLHALIAENPPKEFIGAG